MYIMTWLRSLDEILYEVMSWILFLPVTLWRTLRAPFGMMDYAEQQLTRTSEEEQYQAALSPPLFLVLCLLVAHGIGMSLGEGDVLISRNHGLSGLVSDQTTALLVRIVLFGSFPLFMAARFVRKKRLPLERAALKPIFYAQCYPAGVLALVAGLGGALAMLDGLARQSVGLGIILIALLGYGTLAAIWFARRLKQPLWRGFVHASFGMVEGLLMTVVIAFLFRS